MNMHFYVLSRLLRQSVYVLFSGYLAFVICLYLALNIDSVIRNFGGCFLVILALTHHYISFRVQFDADLLYQFAQINQNNGKNFNEMTHALDQSLIDFKLMPESKGNRSWALRFQGCLKLFKIQVAFFILQWILVLIFLTLQLKDSRII